MFYYHDDNLQRNDFILFKTFSSKKNDCRKVWLLCCKGSNCILCFIIMMTTCKEMISFFSKHFHLKKMIVEKSGYFVVREATVYYVLLS